MFNWRLNIHLFIWLFCTYLKKAATDKRYVICTTKPICVLLVNRLLGRSGSIKPYTRPLLWQVRVTSPLGPLWRVTSNSDNACEKNYRVDNLIGMHKTLQKEIPTFFIDKPTCEIQGVILHYKKCITFITDQWSAYFVFLIMIVDWWAAND